MAKLKRKYKHSIAGEAYLETEGAKSVYFKGIKKASQGGLTEKEKERMGIGFMAALKRKRKQRGKS